MLENFLTFKGPYYLKNNRLESRIFGKFPKHDRHHLFTNINYKAGWIPKKFLTPTVYLTDKLHQLYPKGLK